MEKSRRILSLILCLILLISSLPLSVLAATGENIKIKQVSLGGYHSAAVTENGDLYLWGHNNSGQIGDGSNDDCYTPKKIMSNISSVELGECHSAAISKDGELYVWGAINDSSTPKKIMDNVAQVVLPQSSSGYWRYAAITDTGELYMWGNGYLGNGSSDGSQTPVKILSNVKKVEFGEWHTAAITNTGELYIWGDNTDYKLGDGTTSARTTPYKILSNISDVKLGVGNSAALTTSGILYTWGSNMCGQIGMNNRTATARKTPYAALSGVKKIICADDTTIAIRYDNSLYGFGRVRFSTFGPDDNEYAPINITDNVVDFITKGWLLNGYIISDNNSLYSFDGTVKNHLLNNVISAYSGEEHYAALGTDGSLYMWGNNDYGQLGDGTTNNSTTPLKIDFSNSGGDTGGETPVETKISFGSDRFSFGEDVTGACGNTISTLLLLESDKYNTEDLTIHSTNTEIVEIEKIVHGTGEYVTANENEHIATVYLKLKAPGNSDIMISAPDGTVEWFNVISEYSSYEIKLYSEVPAMVVGKDRSIGAAVQLENNGIVVDDADYSFASSNNNIVSLTDIRKETDGTYFTIKGNNEGTAIITITESNTGAIFSGRIQVNKGILTYNAEALPKYYDRDNEYNGYIGGMYIDEFKSVEKDKDTMSVSFNVYNTANLVGAVDIYDANGNITESKQIKRFDGGYVTSLKDTLISGYKLVEDIFITGNILTYKQDSYSEKTSVSLDVPKGGHIEITNDPLYSNTCAIFNCSEFITTSILMFGDVVDVDAKTQKEIAEITGKNVVDKFLKEYIAALSGKTANEKIINLGDKFIKKLTEKSLKKILESSITGDLASFVDEGKAILNECDIDLEKAIISSAGSIGISIAESTLKKAMGPFGEVLNGMFKFSEYASYSTFLVDICKPHSNHAFYIHFDDENGCLSNNGVAIKAENGTTDLSKSNYVMHSIILSNEKDLTGQMKDSLNNLSDEYIVRNIYLERDGKISQPNQPVQVTIPVPTGWIPDHCKLYWVKDDGTLSEVEAMSSLNNLVFITDHFSYYAIVYDAPCTHTNKTEKPAVASSCIQRGNNLYYVCDDCGTVLKADGVTITTVAAEMLPLADHTYTYINEVPATHYNSGIQEHFVCDNCGKIFDKNKVEIVDEVVLIIPKISHSYGTNWRKDETNHWHECSCGDKTDVAAHIPGAAATETEPQVCTECGYVITPATGHITHGNGVKQNGIAATCTTAGYKDYYKCGGCDNYFEDITCNIPIADIAAWKAEGGNGYLAKIAHTYGTEWKYDDTNHWHECSCGDKTDVAAHIPGAAATETEPQVCTECGYVIAPATGHIVHKDGVLQAGVAATHTTAGYKDYYKCGGCENLFEDITCNIPITDLAAWKAEGGNGYIAPIGHTYGTDWTFDNTNHWHECSCGDKTDVAAHIPGAAATETTPQVCTECGYVIAPALGHQHNNHLTFNAKVDATCTTDGSKAYYSCDCGRNFEDATANVEITENIDTWKNIPAIGHTPEADDGDCTTAIKCSVCGAETTAARPAHTGGTATCTDKAECEVCGKEYGELAAHNFGDDDICDDCGFDRSVPHTHSYGDWKNDGTNHWKECVCGDKAETAAHDFKWVTDKEATKTEAGSKHEECKVCGYKKATVEIPATGTGNVNVDIPKTGGDTESPQTGDNGNMFLWIALLFVSCGGVIGVTVYSKKKKEQAE